LGVAYTIIICYHVVMKDTKLFELPPEAHFLFKRGWMDSSVSDLFPKGIYRRSTTRKGAINFMKRAIAEKLFARPNEIDIDPWTVVEIV